MLATANYYKGCESVLFIAEESANDVTCETVKDYFSKLLEGREALIKVVLVMALILIL